MKSIFVMKFSAFNLAGRERALRDTLRLTAILGVCLLTLAACAGNRAAERDTLVPQRAQARWDALLARDYATAYSYASPGYRSAMSVVDFEIGVRARRLQYTSAEYKEHSCEEAVCTVKMQVGYTVVRPVVGLPEWKSKGVVEERWVEVGGDWWFLPEK